MLLTMPFPLPRAQKHLELEHTVGLLGCLSASQEHWQHPDRTAEEDEMKDSVVGCEECLEEFIRRSLTSHKSNSSNRLPRVEGLGPE
jgi:hypothetical protein